MAKVVSIFDVEDGVPFILPNGPSLSMRRYLYLAANVPYVVQGSQLLAYDSGNLAVSSWPDNYRKYIEQSVEIQTPEMLAARPAPALDTLGRTNDTTGTDPEIFVVTGVERKSLLPAFRFLPTKDEAAAKVNAPGVDIPSAYAYCDGFAAECAVHASPCHGYLIDFIRAGLGHVWDAAKKYNRTADLSIQNTFTIPKTTMDQASDEDVALGCQPSFNVYGDIPTQPTNPKEFNLRFAGGHMHFGYAANRHPKVRIENMIKGADLVGGLAGVAIFASLDEPVRRQFYGRAGEFRLPKHGLEYRVLSNGWLATPQIAHLMLNLVRIGLKVGSAGYAGKLGLTEDEVRNTINTCDVKTARKWLNANFSTLCTLLSCDGNAINSGTGYANKAFNEVINGGIEAVFPDFMKVTRNWHLDDHYAWQGHSDGGKATWAHLGYQTASK